MLKIVHIPLDERPCNYDFPKELFKGKAFNVVKVPLEMMGEKKKPGDLKGIKEFLLNEGKDADACVIALDTLIYGGLVASRLHYLSSKDAQDRLDVLKELKRINPKIKLYCYSLVMRCPSYDDDDEEPFYYQYYGLAIHKRKAIEHKMSLNIATEEEIKEYNNYKIPQEYLDDYDNRRKVNLSCNLKAIDLVNEKIIDFLVIPQDDSAPYGYTALDQKVVRNKISDLNLELKVLNYPGADEVSMVLFAKMLNEYNNVKPKVYVFYPDEACKLVIPCCEDRPLDISVRAQLVAASCMLIDDAEDADFILAINAPAKHMCSIGFEEYRDYYSYEVGRDLGTFVLKIKDFIDKGKKVVVCDIGYANGAEKEFVKLMDNQNLLLKLSGYASWNIPCNSLGTAIAIGVKCLNIDDQESFDDFIMHRFVEDIGYCGCTRTILRKQYCNEEYGFTIYYTKGKRNEKFKEITTNVLTEQLKTYASTISDKYIIEDMWFPWGRTYEIGLKVKVKR